MKKLKLLFTVLLLMCYVGNAKAVEVTINWISYNVYTDTKQATVISRDTKYSGNIVIPSEITYNNVTCSVTSIGEDAFEYCSKLTSITIPSSVTSIESSAFRGCTSLTSITIPNSVTSIGYSAFNNCFGLTCITIPNSVTSIGDYAFYNCTNLKTVYNYSNLTFTKGSSNYGYVAFYADKLYNAPNGSVEGDYIFGKPNGANTLVGYLGNDTEITLPADYYGESYVIGSSAFYGNKTLSSVVIPNSVTSIGRYAFYSCYDLTSVVIPNSVTSIGDAAFAGCGLISITIPNSITSIGKSAFNRCYRLTSITIPNSITSIGNGAFQSCTCLTNITIPNSVTSIGDEAFYDCTGLTSITIPNSVTSIGSSAFYGCDGLTSITVATDNTKYDSRDNCNAIIETESNTLIAGCKNTVIPNSVTSIGDYAFKGCSGLTSITIPNSVTIIGENVFAGCSGLESIVVDPGNTKYDNRDNCNAIIETRSNTLITGCKNTVIPNSVTSIGSYAFYGCTGLTSITIPNSVTSIGRYAFYSCSGLTSVTIGNSVTSIGDSAFGYCSGLKSITIGNSVTSIGDSAFGFCYGLTNVIIGNSVTSIGEYAFVSCTGLTSVVIGNSVTSIGEYAFYDCTHLKTVYNFSILTFTTGSSNDGEIAYYADKVYNVPDSSVEGDYIFGKLNGANTLVVYLGNDTELTLPADYKGENYVIGADAFCGNTALTCVVIPNSVTSIGRYAFSGCSGLTSITIPNSVTSIGYSAFYDCSGLTSITIPNSVTSIGSSAFNGCTGLKTVYNYSNLTFTKGSIDYGCVAFYADKVYNTFEVPEERKYYKIKNVATGLYLQVSGNNTNMTLQEKSDAKLQIFTLEDAGKGKFYIKSTDADNCYYAHATTWNFNATTNANNKTPFKIALLNGETNIYTLYQNVSENVGLAGTDSSNAGAFVFCNKRAENNGKWAFEVFTDEDRIAALENAIANAESVLETRAQLLTNDEKKAISAAVQTANDEKGNTNADVTAEIARLTALSEMVNNAVGDAIYVNAIDEISNAVCYTVSTESRGAWYSEASNLNSTGKLNIAYNITDNKQQFAFIKSPTTGNYYLYSVSEAKFVSKNGDYTTLTETPVQTITFLTGERTASYPWIIALNTADGEKQIAVSNTFEYGIITFYNDLTDAGNTVRLEKVATFDAAAALALINAYENGETAIEEVNVENVNVIIYDLQGRRVKEITEGGIYIINGKKVLVK